MADDNCVYWLKCIICQKSSKEPLQCPAEKSKRVDLEFGSDYVAFSTNLKRFMELNALPIL